MLRSLAVSQPVVMAQAVKGNLKFHVPIQVLQPLESLLVEERSVGVQLFHVHSSVIDGLQNGEEVPVKHGFPAGDGKGVDAAPVRLVDEGQGLLPSELAHQRGVVRRVEAM